jgi:hypothetical protein
MVGKHFLSCASWAPRIDTETQSTPACFDSTSSII